MAMLIIIFTTKKGYHNHQHPRNGCHQRLNNSLIISIILFLMAVTGTCRYPDLRGVRFLCPVVYWLLWAMYFVVFLRHFVQMLMQFTVRKRNDLLLIA